MESQNKPNTQHCQAWRPPARSQKRGVYSKVFFPSDTVGAVALATKTFERERKLSPHALTTSLAFFKADTIAYPDIAADIRLRTGESISPQAVAEKVKKAEPMFRSLCAIALERTKILATDDSVAIPGVGDVLLADATV